MAKPDHQIINDMFVSGDLPKDWNWPNEIITLAIYIILQYVLTLFSLSCPIPCGLFMPAFALGAAFGRFYGSILSYIFNLGALRGGYAIVGAAAFTSSITHTISEPVIVFELTGQMEYMLPILISVLLAYAIGSALSMSIYDVLLNMKGLPFLPGLKSSKLYQQIAQDIMSVDFPKLVVENSDFRDAALIITSCDEIITIPVVNNSLEHVLVYGIKVPALKKYLNLMYSKIAPSLTLPVRTELNKYFVKLTALSEMNREQGRNDESRELENIFSIKPEHQELEDF